ncbi:MAG: geranylgeranylglyceryl/heptaprenylglyceryl phosphate synthase [Nitrososphaerota archaeon]
MRGNAEASFKAFKHLRLGRTERYLLERLESDGCVHLTLFDPENQKLEELARLASMAEGQGTDAFMVGGSTVYSHERFDESIKTIKENTSLPVIIFPNNVNAISKHADAIFFMSLLNSLEWWFILGAQIHGSLLVKEYGLEAIPMGYIVFGSDTSVAVMGRVFPLPASKPLIAASYALAAQYLGMRLVYLEAGSGAASPVPPEGVSIVKSLINVPLIVGGGIRTPEQARTIVEAGADMIVTGTLAERCIDDLGRIIKAAKEVAANRQASRRSV